MTRALALSLILHGLAVVVAALPIVREAVAEWQAAAQARAAAVVPVEAIEVAVVVPEVIVERVPAPPPQSFIRTDGLTEAAPDSEKPRFISDRNTKVASPLPPDPVATEAQPNQEGLDIPVVEVVRLEQSDGEDESLPPAPTAAASVVPSAAATPPTAEIPTEPSPPPMEDTRSPVSEPAVDAAASAEPEPPETPEANRADVPAPVEERLALTNDSDIRITAESPEKSSETTPRPPTESPPRPVATLRDPEVASRPPPPRPAVPQPPPATTPPAGFSGLRTPTRLRGTISNQGPSSVDAEDTPTGRYMKKVTTAIEKEWHRKRRLNRDFVTFGTIKLEFRVDARGHVHNLSIKNRSGANAIMQDFTLNAVLDAQIPPMPAGLHEVLDREMLLISYDIIVY
ncbi:MAG: hypothetical protein ACKV19_08015 [Verrucomicrobiales bacterium]